VHPLTAEALLEHFGLGFLTALFTALSLLQTTSTVYLPEELIEITASTVMKIWWNASKCG
jgi:hypothetical protein